MRWWILLLVPLAACTRQGFFPRGAETDATAADAARRDSAVEDGPAAPERSGLSDERFGPGGVSLLDLPTSGSDRVFDALVPLAGGAFVLQGTFADASSATSGGLIKVRADATIDGSFGTDGVARYQAAGLSGAPAARSRSTRPGASC